jgi:acetyl-CoA synthetase
VVKAFLILRQGFEPCEDLKAEIQSFAKQQMAGYKYPRKIEFVEALPKTTSGKVKRNDLRLRETNEDERGA